MSAVIVVGAQWGDEGKGKIVDLIAGQADLVVRYAGGANAGHTLRVGDVRVVTHLLPSGVMYPRVRCALGSGMVLALDLLVKEIREIEARSMEVRGRLTLSPSAHVTFPFQTAIDRASNAGPRAIGTTGRGIGPTYSDKAARVGVRLGDLCHPTRGRHAVEGLVEVWADRARHVGAEPPTLDDALAWAEPLVHELRPLLGDVSRLVNDALDAGQKVVLEGAQGTLLDLDHGTYPFVTSSNTIAGGACTGVGLGPTRIDGVVGITKAYSTRVGHGAFPTELHGPEGERLREVGEEFGATTGRPRRCGWLDLPALRFAARVNGLTSLVVTKVDVLGGLAEVPLCVGYKVDGAVTDELPIDDLDRAEPVFARFDPWSTEVSKARTEGELPDPVRRYIDAIEARVKVPVAMVSVGADRDATIVRQEIFAR
ncbi:MAG: adenylosuccinate synthase [Polyangiales bacterium]